MSTRCMIIINENKNNNYKSINIINKLVSNDTKDLRMYYKHHDGMATQTIPEIFINAGALINDYDNLSKKFEKTDLYFDDIDYLYILDANADITVIKHYQEGCKGYKGFKLLKEVKYNDIKRFFAVYE